MRDIDGQDEHGAWPFVQGADWCGEYERRPDAGGDVT